MLHTKQVLSFFLLTGSTILSPFLVGSVASFSSSSVSSSVLSANVDSSWSPEVVVVGGGPVGLAAALLLSRPPHSCPKVTVLERSQPSGFNPARAFLYNLNPRGLLCFEAMDRNNQQNSSNNGNTKSSSLMELIMERGSAPLPGTSMGTFLEIPADPDTPIVLTKPKKAVLSAAASSKAKEPDQAKPSATQRSYWIPRHEMVQLLEEECAQQPNIQICHGKQVETLVPSDQSSALHPQTMVQCTDGSSYPASLVVAADGIDSTVRTCLANGTLVSTNNDTNVMDYNPKKFKVKRYKSPATGLQFKALQLPPNFTLTNTDGSTIQSSPETIYVMRSIYTNSSPRQYVSLGLLPTKNPNLVRMANTNTRPNHIIHTLHTGPEMKAWFQTAFPRLPWDTWVADQEWERFATAPATTFPPCQYVPGNAVPNQGIVLVGDACHAFSPDIGQGINAGLQDVLVLDQVLQGKPAICTTIPRHDSKTEPKHDESSPASSTTSTLAQALQRYQDNRGPEHKALIRIARFGAPYQYRQPLYKDTIGRWLWTANVALRLILNKVIKVVPPAAILLLQQYHLTYRQVMRRADWTTAVLKSGLAGILIWKFRLLSWLFVR